MKGLVKYLNTYRKTEEFQYEIVGDFGDIYPNARAIYYNIITQIDVFRIFALVAILKQKKRK